MKKDLKKVVLVDIDDTVSRSVWREGLIPKNFLSEDDWDPYHAAAERDAADPSVVRLICALFHNFSRVVLLTARPEKWRSQTVKWFEDLDCPFDDLIMRPLGCLLGSVELKLQEAERLLGPNWPEHVALLIEDREDVAMAFVARGVTVLQARHGKTEERKNGKDD